MRALLINTMLFISIVLTSPVSCMAFSLSPMTIEIDASPGDRHTGSITVYNPSSKDEYLNVYPLDWDRLPDGSVSAMPAGSLPRSCADWIDISPTVLNAPASDKSEIKYSFSVPENATGSYWTYLMVEGREKPSPPSMNSKKVNFVIASNLRVAVRIVVNVSTGVNEAVEIYDFRTEPGVNVDTPVFYVGVNNSGNTFIKPYGYLEIKDATGKTIQSVGIKRFSVLPNHKYILKIKLPEDVVLAEGEYPAVCILDYGGYSLIAAETSFQIPSS